MTSDKDRLANKHMARLIRILPEEVATDVLSSLLDGARVDGYRAATNDSIEMYRRAQRRAKR